MKFKTFAFIPVLFFFFAGVISATTGPTYAIVHCRIISPSLPTIEKGVIIIRDGIIEAVGPEGKIPIPEEAEVIEAEGLTAYPGFIDAHTNLFLETAQAPEQPAPAGRTPSAGQAQEERRPPQPGALVIDQIKPRQAVIDSFHKIGVTTVLVAPDRGIFAGQSVLLNLNGEKLEEMVVKNPVALHLQFVTERGGYPNSPMGTVAFIRQSLLDANYYAEHLATWRKTPRFLVRPTFNRFYEALTPFVTEKRPVIFTCNNQEDIKRALRLTQEFKLQTILSGANEAWRVIDELKALKTQLLIALNFRPPTTSFYAAQGEEARRKAEEQVYPANAAELYKAGFSFALTSLGLSDAASFQKNWQKAVKAGLPAEAALKALTIIPAQILGVDSFLGTIEAGKIANLFLCSGDIFSSPAQVEKVWVDGRMFKIEKAPEAKAPAAISVAGSWKVTVSGAMGQLDMTMELEQEGNVVRGYISSSYGRWEITDGRLSGQELTFNFSATIMGQTMEIGFAGKAEKDLIEGTVQVAGSSADFRATRIPRERGGERS